jgi:hypothetical protein
MTVKQVTAEMWEEIYRVTRQAEVDHYFSVKEGLLAVGRKHGFSEADLIDAHILDDPEAGPRDPGALKGSVAAKEKGAKSA